MALGPIMRLETSTGTHLELAPFTKEEALKFLDGFSKHMITRYLSNGIVPSKETEEEWYDKMVHEKTSRVWGIWVVMPNERTLIGSFDLKGIDREVLAQAINGIVIFDTSYWGKGVASAVHRATLQYAFKQLGLVRVKSAVLRGNGASLRSMEKAGFSVVYTERNTHFRDGSFRHQDNLECLNPDDWAWRQWWGEDRPTRKAVEARAKTLDALEWAEKHVELA